MLLQDFFPFWGQLSAEQRQLLEQAAKLRRVQAGVLLHNGAEDCVGLMAVTQGQLRVYIVSEEGREVTLYRLFERDVCLFSAACMMNNIQFDLMVSAEQATSFYLVPADLYHRLMQRSVAVANYTNQLMASRFTDVMWLLDQILSKRMDSRVAAFLLEEYRLTGSCRLKLTHELIARHLGSAREVVTRMLKYFHAEGLVDLSRGEVQIAAPERLEAIAQASLR